MLDVIVAMKHIRTLMHDEEGKYYKSFTDSLPKFDEDYDTVMKALEKQIYPKKPRRVNYEDYIGGGYQELFCPDCGEPLMDSFSFCPSCGRAIDFEEDEE